MRPCRPRAERARGSARRRPAPPESLLSSFLVFLRLEESLLFFIVIFETRGVFTFTTGVCSGGGRGDPPETLNGLRLLLLVLYYCLLL